MPDRTLIDVLDDMAPDMSDAFLRAFGNLKTSVDLSRLETALATQNVDAVIEVLNISPQFLEPMRETLRDAFVEGGRFTIAQIDGTERVGVFEFMPSTSAADTALRGIAGSMVTGIVAGSVEDVRRYLVDAFARRVGPKEAARDLVGRFDSSAGRRVGGIVGLTAEEMTFAQTALEELLSGDRAQLRNYLKRKTRDRRFDSIAERALADRRPVRRDRARKMISRMHDRLLAVRGLRIAQHEMLQALHAGQETSLNQLVENGVPPDAIKGTWDATGDGLTRPTHSAADGQERLLGEAFNVGNSRLLYPHDLSLNAELKEVMNCRCHRRVSIDFSRVP